MEESAADKALMPPNSPPAPISFDSDEKDFRQLLLSKFSNIEDQLARIAPRLTGLEQNVKDIQNSVAKHESASNQKVEREEVDRKLQVSFQNVEQLSSLKAREVHSEPVPTSFATFYPMQKKHILQQEEMSRFRTVDQLYLNSAVDANESIGLTLDCGHNESLIDNEENEELPLIPEDSGASTRMDDEAKKLHRSGSFTAAAQTGGIGTSEYDESIRISFSRIYHAQPINVEGTLATAMDMAFLVVGTIICIVIIFAWHPGTYPSQTSTPPLWLVIQILATEAFTALWMCMRCFIRSRKGEWEIVEDLSEIRKIYFQTWFFYDLIYTLPIEFIFVGWANIFFYITIFRHLLRYLRGLSLGKSNNPLLSSRRKGFSFVSYCCTLLLASHIIACIFWAIPNEDCSSYVDALYWATATLTGTGYGDIVASNQDSRIYSVLCMIAGIITVSTFTAFATKFITFRNVIEEEKMKKKETMYTMMRHYNVPWDLQTSVMTCFSSVINRNDERQFKALTDDLPQALRDQLGMYFHAHLMKQVPLFAHLPNQDVIVQFARRMQKLFVQPGSRIFSEGETGTELFFIISGVVEIQGVRTFPASTSPATVSPPSSIIARAVGQPESQSPAAPTTEMRYLVLRAGQCFGEAALLEQLHRRSTTAVAKTPCELILLRYKEFHSVVRRYLSEQSHSSEGITTAIRSQVNEREKRMSSPLSNVARPY